MTRKNSTVNPKAGTLKQQDRELRISSQSRFVKSIAFALILSMTAPTITQAMDEVADTGKGVITRIDSSKPDNCCVLDNGQKKYKVVRLIIPSRDMIRKSDSEANRNLVSSLSESKLHRMKSALAVSDKEINTRFSMETRIQHVGDLRKSDDEMSIHFKAENIQVTGSAAIALADAAVQESFTLNTRGIRFSAANSPKADAEMNQQFVWSNTKIAVPSAAVYALADQEMIVKGQAVGAPIAAGKY